MLQRLLAWLFPARQPQATPPPCGTPASDALSVDGEKSVIRREPVLDRQQHLIGYELGLRQGKGLQQRESSRNLRDKMLLSHLQMLDLGRLLGNRSAFIHLDVRHISDPVLASLPARQMVLLLELSDGVLAEPLFEIVSAYRSLGMRFGLSIRQHRHPLATLLQPLLSFVLLEPDDPLTWSSSAADWIGSLNHVQLLARHIDSEEAFLSAHRSLLYGGKVELFHGNFITQRHPWPSHPVEPGRMQIIELMNQLHNEADNEQVANTLKQDSVLLYRILRLVNSPALRGGQPITSAEDALMVLGREQLFRWLTVLLFQLDGEAARDLSLLDMALIRARFMETLGGPSQSPQEANQRFLVGLFSLLDVLLQIPLERALGLLQLPESVSQALLQQSGPHAAYLQLAQMCEGDELEGLADAAGSNQPELEPLLQQLQLQPHQVDTCHLSALLWAESLRP
jgi:EAL and modified HD-GYP domain-containing signal transduction protein